MTTIQPHNMKSYLILLGAVLLLASCNRNTNTSDAYGNFEATETTVSSEEPGKLLFLSVEEGNAYGVDSLVGLIDTSNQHLTLLQLKAARKTAATKTGNISAQIDVLEEQKKNAVRELERFKKMAKEGAATSKQVDDIQGNVDVVNSQINSIRTQNAPVLGELNTHDAQIAIVEEHIRKCHIRTPVKGTVLVKSAEAGEVVSAGKPLFRIADLQDIYLRVYVSGDQLPNIKLGQDVKVLVDKDAKQNRELKGSVTWVSAKAEFTPKIVQTKEERTNLVYAVKVKVANDGSLKIGMPGEVNFK